MAILKGREVILLGRTDGGIESPLFDIQDQDGQRSSVKLSELQLTEEEVKKYTDDSNPMNSANVIKTSDLQKLRDSQDFDKVKAQQEKDSKKGQDVSVSNIKVNSAEVANKAK